MLPPLSPDTEQARRTLSRIGLAYFAFFAAAYLGQLLLVLLLDAIAPALSEKAIYPWLISMIPMYGLAFPIFFLVISPLKAAALPARPLRVRNFFLFFLAAYAVMYLCNLAGAAINALTDAVLGTASSSDATALIADSPLGYVLFFAVFLGPLVEELMFRRLILTRLTRFGEGFAILGSALLFAFFHGNLAQFLYAFAVGILLGYLYTLTGRLLLPVLLHVLLNLSGSILPLLLLKLADLERIESVLSAEEITSEILLSILPSLLALFAYVAVLGLTVLAGILVLVLALGRIALPRLTFPAPRGERRYLLLSIGSGLLFLTVAVCFFLSYLK